MPPSPLIPTLICPICLGDIGNDQCLCPKQIIDTKDPTAKPEGISFMICDGKFPRLTRAVMAVSQFHRLYEQPIRTYPQIPPTEQERELCKTLIREEYEKELVPALESGDLVQIADASADLIFVVLGMCLRYGIPIDACFDEVVASNLTKLGEDGKPIKRADGKTMKGPNFRPPDITAILEQAIAMSSEKKEGSNPNHA